MPLDQLPVVEHLVCDNPIYTHVVGDEFDHLAGGTQASDIAWMHTGGRGGGVPFRLRDDRPGRAALAASSRAPRGAVLDGWDRAAIGIAVAVAGTAPGQVSLW